MKSRTCCRGRRCFRSIEVVPDDAVLARLKDPPSILTKRRWFRANFPFYDLSALIAAPPAAPSAAKITNYQSQYVAIEAEFAGARAAGSQRHQLSRLARLCERAAGRNADREFLFRGVLLPPGKSLVEFKYQPRSFQIGGGFRSRRSRSWPCWWFASGDGRAGASSPRAWLPRR